MSNGLLPRAAAPRVKTKESSDAASKSEAHHCFSGVTFGGQTLFSFPAVCGRKEVARVQKKAFRLVVCAVILLYIFCIKAH